MLKINYWFNDSHKCGGHFSYDNSKISLFEIIDNFHNYLVKELKVGINLKADKIYIRILDENKNVVFFRIFNLSNVKLSKIQDRIKFELTEVLDE